MGWGGYNQRCDQRCDERTTNNEQQLPEYSAFQIFQSMAGLGSLANLEFGNILIDSMQFSALVKVVHSINHLLQLQIAFDIELPQPVQYIGNVHFILIRAKIVPKYSGCGKKLSTTYNFN